MASMRINEKLIEKYQHKGYFDVDVGETIHVHLP